MSHKRKKYTHLEKELLASVANLVYQNLQHEQNGVYESGWISCHKTAMMILVEHGVMILDRNGYGRGYWAHFPENYEFEAEIYGRRDIVLHDYTGDRQ
jgi:hypothetical protein